MELSSPFLRGRLPESIESRGITHQNAQSNNPSRQCRFPPMDDATFRGTQPQTNADPSRRYPATDVVHAPNGPQPQINHHPHAHGLAYGQHRQPPLPVERPSQYVQLDAWQGVIVPVCLISNLSFHHRYTDSFLRSAAGIRPGFCPSHYVQPLHPPTS